MILGTVAVGIVGNVDSGSDLPFGLLDAKCCAHKLILFDNK